MRQMHLKDAYDALGLPQQSSLEEVKNAYKKLAFQFHPDKNSAPDATQKFQEIGAAYNRLVKHLEGPSEGDYFDDGDGPDEMDLDFFLFMFSRMFAGTRREGGLPPFMFASGPSLRVTQEQRQKQEQAERAAFFAERKQRSLEAQLEEKKKELAKLQQQQRDEVRISSQRKQQKQKKKEDRTKSRQQQEDTVKETRRASQRRRSDVFEMARAGDAEAVKKGIWEQNVDAAGQECLVGMEDDPTYLDRAHSPSHDKKETLLHIFARSGDLETLKWLLNHNAEVEDRDSYDRTAFHVALQRAHVPIISFFLETFPPDSEDSKPIFKAPKVPSLPTGHYSILRLALDSAALAVVQIVLAHRLFDREELQEAWKYLINKGRAGPVKGYGDEMDKPTNISPDEKFKKVWASIKDLVRKEGNFETPPSPLPTPVPSPSRATQALPQPSEKAETSTHNTEPPTKKKKRPRKPKKKANKVDASQDSKEPDAQSTDNLQYKVELSPDGKSVVVSLFGIYEEDSSESESGVKVDTTKEALHRSIQKPEDAYPSPISGYPSSPETATHGETFHSYSNSATVGHSPSRAQHASQRHTASSSLAKSAGCNDGTSTFDHEAQTHAGRAKPSSVGGSTRPGSAPNRIPIISSDAATTATQSSVSPDTARRTSSALPSGVDVPRQGVRRQPALPGARRDGRGHAQADDGGHAQPEGRGRRRETNGGANANGQNGGPESRVGGGKGAAGRGARGGRGKRGAQRGRGRSASERTSGRGVVDPPLAA